MDAARPVQPAQSRGGLPVRAFCTREVIPMHSQAALDYDLEVFAPREERRIEPLKVVKNKKKKKTKLFGRFAVDMK